METTLNAVQVASLLVGTIIPIVVGLVTHANMKIGPVDVRPILLAVLSAASAVITEWLNVNNRGDDFNWTAAAITAVMTFVVAAGVHYGFWKPTGVAEVAKLTLVRPPDSNAQHREGDIAA